MSAADASAIRYVACLVHKKRDKTPCRCERCTSIRRVVRLATAHVSSMRRKPPVVKATPVEAVAAIDAANAKDRLCTDCMASYATSIVGLCDSCLHQFTNDETPTSTNEAHAA